MNLSTDHLSGEERAIAGVILASLPPGISPSEPVFVSPSAWNRPSAHGAKLIVVHVDDDLAAHFCFSFRNTASWQAMHDALEAAELTTDNQSPTYTSIVVLP